MKGTWIEPDGTVVFIYYAPKSEVKIAGNFTNWRAINMELEKDRLSREYFRFKLWPGAPCDIIYKFIVNGWWKFDQYNFRRTLDGLNSFIHRCGNCGQLVRDSFFSKFLNKEKYFVCYLPPSYPFNKEKYYPCLYLLPGLLDYEGSFARNAYIAEIMDELIIKEVIGEFIIVMPDKDDLALNPEGFEDYYQFLTQDLVSHIEFEFRAIQQNFARAIDGISIGATWALRVGLTAPDIFTSIGAMSGGTGQEQYFYARENAEQLRQAGSRFLLSSGTEEPNLAEINNWFKMFLTELGISCYTLEAVGPHDWVLWRDTIRTHLKFHNDSFSIHGIV